MGKAFFIWALERMAYVVLYTALFYYDVKNFINNYIQKDYCVEQNMAKIALNDSEK